MVTNSVLSAGRSTHETIGWTKGIVKMMLIGKDEKPMDQLVTIDLLQRLGVSYDFEDEIKSILDCRYKNYDRNNMWKAENLYATALEFRLLRQHGHKVPQGIWLKDVII